MLYYKHLDLPPLPLDLTQRILDFASVTPELPPTTAIPNQLTKGNQTINNLQYLRRSLTGEYFDWAKKHILKDTKEISVSISNFGPGSMAPHTDRKRDWVLLYIIEQGGENAATTFWQEHNKPILRRRMIAVNNYDTLDRLDYCVFQKGNWYLATTRVLHSVENVETRRIGAQLAVHDDDSIYSQLESIVGQPLRIDQSQAIL